MPYYSVRISADDDEYERVSYDARNVLGGVDADYTGVVNFFYVHKNYNIDILINNVQSLVGRERSIEVKKIKKAEFFWKKYRNY